MQSCDPRLSLFVNPLVLSMQCKHFVECECNLDQMQGVLGYIAEACFPEAALCAVRSSVTGIADAPP